MLKNSENNNIFPNNRLHTFLYVWIAAFIGFIFFIPAIPKLIPANTHLPFSMNILILISILQSIIFTALFAAAGAILAPRIGFRACLVDVPIKKKAFWIILKRQFYFGAPIGLAGSIIAYFIAPDFIAYLNKYPLVWRFVRGSDHALGYYDHYNMDFMAHISTQQGDSKKITDLVGYSSEPNTFCQRSCARFNKTWHNQSGLVRIDDFHRFSPLGLVILETRVGIGLYSACKLSRIRSSVCCSKALSYQASRLVPTIFVGTHYLTLPRPLFCVEHRRTTHPRRPWV